MHLRVVLERGFDRRCRQSGQCGKVERVGLVEGHLLLDHHLVERRIERPTIDFRDGTADGQQSRPAISLRGLFRFGLLAGHDTEGSRTQKYASVHELLPKVSRTQGVAGGGLATISSYQTARRPPPPRSRLKPRRA